MRWLPLLLALATLPGARAQADWSTLTPGAGPAVVVGEPLAPWTAGPGAAVRIETPAYGGRARAEIRGVAFAAADPALADFTVLMPTLGWGPAVAVGAVRVGAGARLGIIQFRFDDPGVGNYQNELEAAVGAWAGVAVTLGRAEVWAEADALRLALSEPTVLVGLAGGVAVPFGTPGWLRGVLE